MKTKDKPSNILSLSRDSLIDAHIIHDFESDIASRNHHGCYGELIKRRYRDILGLLVGNRIVDCGSGFGTFARVAQDGGYDVYPVDIDDKSIEFALNLNGISVNKESAYQTALPENSRDVAVCFDSIQHLDLNFLLPELNRIGVRQVVIYDSNVLNPFLRMYRHAKDHHESQELLPDEIIEVFTRNGFKTRLIAYENVISLPISGGYQRPPFPLLHHFPGLIAAMDAFLTRLIRLLGLSRWLTFRFLIVLEKADVNP